MLQSYNVLGDQDALAIATESFIEMLGTANSGNPSVRNGLLLPQI
jgi:hypothetical protein